MMFSTKSTPFAVLLRTVLAACTFVLLTALSARAAECRASFPLESGKRLGWQGADAAYSIPLPDGRDVWIFGDTLYGPKRVVEGQQPKMVHNSLGISTCKDGHWNLTYVIRHDDAGHAVSYFSPDDPSHWYWALDGFYANGSLWVTLLCIRHPSKPAPAAFDFETCGSDLAQITDLNKDPHQWKVTIRPLVEDGIKAYPSASTVVYDGYAYFFALYENGTRPLLVTRVTLGKLTAAHENLEYLAKNGTWKSGFNPADAKEVMEHGSTELSVRYHPKKQLWFAVMVDPSFLSDKVLFKTAPSLKGPWTTGDVIYQIPEMQQGPSHDKNVFCYAGKEHPELEGASDIVFTYVCNTMNVPDLVKKLDIYRPVVIRQNLPASLSH